MKIPRFIISMATFPGIITHGIAQRFFLDLVKVPVYKVCYFWAISSGPAGYIIHAPVTKLLDVFLISIGPLLINTLLCALLTFVALFPIVILQTEDHSMIFDFLLWIGVSMGMNAIPSPIMLENLEEELNNSKQNKILIIGLRIYDLLLKIANFLRTGGFDVIYTFCVVAVLPCLFHIWLFIFLLPHCI